MERPEIFKLPRLRGLSDPLKDADRAGPLGGSRAEATQRLQVGLSGIAAMVLLVGLANIIQDRARVTEQAAVPDASPTTEPVAAPAQRDPLADAGVVPDLPVEPVVTPETDPLLEEEQNDVTNSPAR